MQESRIPQYIIRPKNTSALLKAQRKPQKIKQNTRLKVTSEKYFFKKIFTKYLLSSIIQSVLQVRKYFSNKFQCHIFFYGFGTQKKSYFIINYLMI